VSSLAKRTVAMALDGALADRSDPIARDGKIEFLVRFLGNEASSGICVYV